MENYAFIREVIIPKFDSIFTEYGKLKENFLQMASTAIIQKDIDQISENLNELLIRMFLFILSNRFDTLIMRKTSEFQSQAISNKASILWEHYSQISRNEWFTLVREFDEDLQNSGGKLNPGTTADFLACSVFLYLIKEMLFQ